MSDISIFINLSYTDTSPWLLKEFDHYTRQLGRKSIRSIYFSGNCAPAPIQKILAHLQTAWDLTKNAEITAATYSDLSYDYQDLKEAGVNRLNWASAALGVLAVSAQHFENVGVDVYYNAAPKNRDQVLSTLKQAFQHPIKHVSLYEGQNGDDLDTYEAAEILLNKNGFRPYDPFHFAKQGFESAHQQTYNSYQEYIGLGPGAHGRFQVAGNLCAAENHSNGWGEVVKTTGHGIKHLVTLTEEEILNELLLQGLGAAGGVSNTTAQNLLGKSLTTLLDATKVNALEAQGLIADNDNTLKTTRNGRFKVHSIVKKLTH